MLASTIVTKRGIARAAVRVAALTLVASLWWTGVADESAHAQQAPANESTTLLRAYPCPGGDAEAMAARLRVEYQGIREVRIAADARSGQILVQAPPAVQAQIAQRLSALPPAAGSSVPRAPAGNGQPTAALDLNVPRTLTVPVRNVSVRQIEDAVVAVFGRRLTSAPPGELGARSYQVSLPGGGVVRLDVHEQTNRATLQGPAGSVDSFARLIQSIDAAEPPGDRSTRLLSLRGVSPASARRAVDALSASGASRTARGPLVAMLFQQPDEDRSQPAAEPPAREPPAAKDGAGGVATPAVAAPGKKPEGSGLIGAVQIELLDGLDVLVLRGHKRDVERVMEIIGQIERLSAETEPAIEVYSLRHVDSQAITEMIIPLYDEIFFPRRGEVSITALVKPNALLLIGRKENVKMVIELVQKVDRPVAPDTQFQVFRLRHAAAATAQTTLLDFYAQKFGGLTPRIRLTSDYRSNALIVQASPRDLAEVADLIARIDTPVSEAVNELRIFKLENTLADEMANILMGAITGQAVQRAAGAAAFGGLPGVQQQPAAGLGAAQQKSTMLRFVTVDPKGQRRLNSGILTDVKINADTRSNSLLVSAPADSMELLDALIRQLDKIPSTEVQIKVFTIVNADATSLANMLQTLFARQTTPGQGGAQVQASAVEGESSLIPLRFAVDIRSNSIITSGPAGFLQVVEAILLRLDDSDVRHRKSVVYRLKNAPANDVSNAINSFLQSERQVQTISPGLTSAAEQIEREVVVVPEPVSNSLIVSATPRFFDEVKKIVEQLDERPAMVMIQVLIAEISLNNTDEFGIELGLQDGILFDRSLLGNITTLTQTTYNPSGVVASSNQQIASATFTPGFAFNNQPLGQSAGTGTQSTIGSQGISNFGVSRTNSNLGFGGLVMSASSENISVLIRALKECHRLEVLSRPQVMTLDNQPAFIQVGQRVPRITGSTINQTGQVNNITLENVGLILAVTPRISPDGLVVMAIDAEKSQVGPIAEGIPVSISATGQVINSPRIDTTVAQTTVSAISGQTVVLGGLITKSTSEFHRKVPLLGDIPILGRLFRYDGVIGQKNELLIIMTPHIVRNEADAELIKRTESARIHWCLADVVAMHGRQSERGRSGDWANDEVPVVYPDLDPGGQIIATPEAVPNGPEIVPAPGGPSAKPPAAPGNGPAPSAAPARPTPAAPPLHEPPSEPKLPPPPGNSGGPPPTPGAAEFRVRPAEQAYLPPAWPPGGVQQAVYQGTGQAPGQNYVGPGAVAPASYSAPPQYPIAPPAQPPYSQQPSPAAALQQQPPFYR